jgi:hypothetical protein
MTKDDLMRRTDNGMRVFSHYIPEVRLKKKLISPIRPEKHPSFNLFLHQSTNEVWFRDFGASDEAKGNCINFVMLKESLDYFDAKKYIESRILNEISADFPERNRVDYATLFELNSNKFKKQVVITPVVKEWSQFELNWWYQFGITKEVLDAFCVSTLSKYYMETEDETKEYFASYSNPIFCISINGRYKIYRPLGDAKFKWRSNLQGDKDIFGWNMMAPRMDSEKFFCCFIMAGNKDVMSFHSLTGLPAIALNSETAHIPFEYKASLKNNFQKIFILYDNDETGLKAAESLNLSTGFPMINYLLDMCPEVKDFAEMVQKHPESLPEFMEGLKNLLEI